ncbi:MAG: tetratricopeptide repeat protein [Ideonella sp.]|nr:tetratricopeptide repeat protein [Ideonella sp.]
MATNLDLQEQEQLDELKAFWKQWGNLITWTLTLVLAAFAAWNGWNWWQGQQGAKAALMFDELDRAVQAGEPDKAAKVFADMKERYAGALVTQQAGLMAAKTQFEKGQVDAAVISLSWVAEKGNDEHAALARLHLASVYLDKKAYDEALKQLDGVKAAEFEALIQDRRGDVLKAQDKMPDAIKAWRAAWDKLDDTAEYRRIVEAKLISAGAAPVSVAASGAKP